MNCNESQHRRYVEWLLVRRLIPPGNVGDLPADMHTRRRVFFL